MSEERHYVLRIEQQGSKARLADLVIDRYSLGRAREVDGSRVDFILEDDAAVSRLHCLLVRDGSGYALENRSANGTLVGGELVEDRVVLEPGATIKIGERVTLTLHHYTTEERAKAFSSLGTADTKQSTEPKKSFFQSPAFIGILVFYGVLGLVALALMGEEAPTSVDPGPGPEYFGALVTERLGTTGEVTEGRREAADRMWQETLAEYGGPMAGVGGNDYRVLLRARWVLRALGYGSVKEAHDANENIANEFMERKVALEAQLSKWYVKAKENLRAGRKDQARTYLDRIKHAVPQSDQNIRRWAAERLRRLGPKREK